MAESKVGDERQTEQAGEVECIVVQVYVHHGKEMAVMEANRGKHRNNCLCFFCPFFKPEDREANCEIANALFRFDILAGVTTPVWECGKLAQHIRPLLTAELGARHVGLSRKDK